MTREELLPQELLEQIPALDSDEETTANEIIIKVKYFLSNFTWLVAKCETRGDDVRFYGYVINHSNPHFSEWGFFKLSELMKLNIENAIWVERDIFFKECTFGEYKINEGLT